jgi:hypothetical protein
LFSRFSCFAKLVSFLISAVSRNCENRETRLLIRETQKSSRSQFRKVFAKRNFVKNPRWKGGRGKGSEEIKKRRRRRVEAKGERKIGVKRVRLLNAFANHIKCLSFQ